MVRTLRSVRGLGLWSIGLLSLSLLGAGWLTATLTVPTTSPSNTEPKPPPPPPPPDPLAVDAMLRAGLDPETLAAAGISSASVAGIVADVRAYLAQNTALATLDADYLSAKTTHDALERKIQSGLASDSEVSSFAGAKSSLQAADTARQSALDGIFAAGIADLPTAQANALTQCLANGSWGLSPEFLVISRSQQDWVDLRAALKAEKVNQTYGYSLDATAQQRLSDARSNASVAAAKVSLATNCDSIQSAWDAACAQQ